jgi:hypothetical protein
MEAVTASLAVLAHAGQIHGVDLLFLALSVLFPALFAGVWGFRVTARRLRTRRLD